MEMLFRRGRLIWGRIGLFLPISVRIRIHVNADPDSNQAPFLDPDLDPEGKKVKQDKNFFKRLATNLSQMLLAILVRTRKYFFLTFALPV